ncbi:MAG: hypothetical protein A2044_03170 [Candidatus Firestonebacteria bacterium GWA2_43_8]|nr:MAG: hypothetical protein A2044_03170 [Candidatus Firestonebacteria bacterium GWA2_43_8]
MKTIFLLALASAFLCLSVPVYAESSDAVKEAIEKARKDREADAQKREASKSKASAGGGAASIPGRLVFMGKVERIDFGAKSTTKGVITIKLNNGQSLKVNYGPNFIKNKIPIGLTNIVTGMDVAIVNAAPSIAAPLPGQAPMDPKAMEKLLGTCTMSAASRIYCGNDAGNLEKYYPSKK